MKIAIIIAYFGKLPEYIQLFLVHANLIMALNGCFFR